MRGLLTDPGFMIGMGLLANGGPSRSPVNPMRGALQGLLASSQIQEQQQKRAMEQARIEQEMAYRRALEENMRAQQAHQTRQHELDVSQFEWNKNKTTPHSNVKIDQNGVAWGVNPSTGVFEQVPMTGGGQASGSSYATKTAQERIDEATKRAREAAEEDRKARAANMTAENSLRDDYIKQTQDFRDIADAYVKVDAATPTAAGDMALIFNYMKILDPGSTVREGEYATARNAGGIPDRIRATYNKILRGEELSDNQRINFKSEAGSIYQSQATRFGDTRRFYQNRAQAFGLAPEIFQDYSAGITIPETPDLISDVTEGPATVRSSTGLSAAGGRNARNKTGSVSAPKIIRFEDMK